MKVFIYALTDPRSGKVRYIGKSENPDKRLYMHLWNAKNTDKQWYCLRWLRVLISLDLKHGLLILEETTPEDWQERERFFIALYGGLTDLTNLTEGGDGVISPRSEEWKKRIGEAHRGKVVSEATRALLREVNKYTHATHCAAGHEYTPENTGYSKEGHRKCRTCLRANEESKRRAAGMKPRQEWQAERDQAEFCKNGHKLEGSNLRILERPARNGRAIVLERICRECVRRRNAESKKRTRKAEK